MRLPISGLVTCLVSNWQRGLRELHHETGSCFTYGLRIEPVHMLGIVAAYAIVGQLMIL